MKLMNFATLITAALIGTASADSFGLRGNYGSISKTSSLSALGFGLQYQKSLDDLSTARFSVDFFPNIYQTSILGIGANLAYLRKIPTGNSTDNHTSFYVGADLGVLYASDSSDSLNNISAQLLGGLNYFVTPDMSLFAEIAGGPGRLSSGSASTFILALNGRFGLNYSFR